GIYGVSSYSNEDTAVTFNNIPVIDFIANQQMRYGTSRQLAVVATDADAEVLTVQVINLPDFAEFVPGTNGGVISFSPAFSENVGTYDGITVIARDGHNGADTVVFTMIV